MGNRKRTVLVTGVLGDIAQKIVINFHNNKLFQIIGLDIKELEKYSNSKISGMLTQYFQLCWKRL